jgi:hypothetical protein
VPYLVLGVALLGVMFLTAHWFVNADPKSVVRVLKWVGIPVLVAVVLFLAVTGRLGLILVLLPMLLPLFARLKSASTNAKNFSRMAGSRTGTNGASGQTSTVETRILKMVLDHDSGTMTGQVREGPRTGRQLATMTLPELLELLNYCHLQDQPSAQVLESYLDRSHPDWRTLGGAGSASGDGNARGSSNSGGFGRGGLSRDESYKILGLEPGASVEEIKTAYHRLMSALHPDKGGSTYLAAKLNEAREVLLQGH